MNKEQNLDIALLLLRIGVGVIFLFAGWGKLTGIEGTQAFFATLGIPLAGPMAWIVALVEFFGGAMLLLGVFIRIPALLLAIIMVVAILTTKLGESFNEWYLDIILLFASLALALTSSGKYALDRTALKQRGSGIGKS